MLALHVMLKIKPDCMVEFIPLMTNQAKNSLQNEAGCKRFDICVRTDEPNQMFLYEVYDSQESLEIHRSTEYFKKYSVDTADLVEEKSSYNLRSNFRFELGI